MLADQAYGAKTFAGRPCADVTVAKLLAQVRPALIARLLRTPIIVPSDLALQYCWRQRSGVRTGAALLETAGYAQCRWRICYITWLVTSGVQYARAPVRPISSTLRWMFGPDGVPHMNVRARGAGDAVTVNMQHCRLPANGVNLKSRGISGVENCRARKLPSLCWRLTHTSCCRCCCNSASPA